MVHWPTRHLLFCYAGGLIAGLLLWWLSDNPWYGVGGTAAFITVYTFLLAGKLAPASGRKTPPSAAETRQMRRQAERRLRKSGERR